MRVSNKGLYPKRKPPLFRGGHYFSRNIEKDIFFNRIYLKKAVCDIILVIIVTKG